MNKSVPAKFGILNRFLNVVERLGNKLPHITMLFIYALIFTMLLSLALSYVDFDYIHPNTHEKIKIINMFPNFYKNCLLVADPEFHFE